MCNSIVDGKFKLQVALRKKYPYFTVKLLAKSLRFIYSVEERELILYCSC